jgi:hypothetical protein
VTNWAAYDAALRQRGSLIVRFTDEAVAAWRAAPRTTPGGQPFYSALAITTALTLRAVFRLVLRQTEGLIGSILHLLGLDLAVPDHTTLSRRAETLQVPRPQPSSEPLHLLVDSTGLRLCGPGEWLVEKHGSRAQRSWKKLHLATDADTSRIVASALTGNEADDGSQVGPLLDRVDDPVASFIADGAYDREGVYGAVAARHPDAVVIVPPRSGAKPADLFNAPHLLASGRLLPTNMTGAEGASGGHWPAIPADRASPPSAGPPRHRPWARTRAPTMPIHALGEWEPDLPEPGRFWVAPDAHVIGRVRLGMGVGIWFGAVLHGDNELLEIGARSNIQEGAMLHTDAGFPLNVRPPAAHTRLLQFPECRPSPRCGYSGQEFLRPGSGRLAGAEQTVTEATTVNVLLGQEGCAGPRSFRQLNRHCRPHHHRCCPHHRRPGSRCSARAGQRRRQWRPPACRGQPTPQVSASHSALRMSEDPYPTCRLYEIGLPGETQG